MTTEQPIRPPAEVTFKLSTRVTTALDAADVVAVLDGATGTLYVRPGIVEAKWGAIATWAAAQVVAVAHECPDDVFDGVWLWQGHDRDPICVDGLLDIAVLEAGVIGRHG